MAWIALKDRPPPTPEDEEVMADRSRLLCEGKLMKALNRARLDEVERYLTFSRIARYTATAENKIGTESDEYLAKWRKRYKGQSGRSNDLADVIALFSHLGVLQYFLDYDKFEFTTSHRLDPRWANRYWLRRLWIRLGLAFTGVCAVITGLRLFFMLPKVSTPVTNTELSAWMEIAAYGLLLTASVYTFLGIKRLAVPKPLRMYAGGTFELVSLKRVKTPKP